MSFGFNQFVSFLEPTERANQMKMKEKKNSSMNSTSFLTDTGYKTVKQNICHFEWWMINWKNIAYWMYIYIYQRNETSYTTGYTKEPNKDTEWNKEIVKFFVVTEQHSKLETIPHQKFHIHVKCKLHSAVFECFWFNALYSIWIETWFQIRI